jgi:hypothetical protein
MNYIDLEKVFKIENTNINVVPFESYLLKVMDLYEVDQELFTQFPDYLSFINNAAKQGNGFAVCVDGKPMTCFGVVPLWKGVGEIWMIPDKFMLSKFKTKFHKGAFKFMLTTAKQLKLHRIQCTVKSNNTRAIKWIESMKFLKEGIVKQYGPDKEDYIMYARLF